MSCAAWATSAWTWCWTRKGPLILELNARPGLNIQIANDCGLTQRTHAVEAHLEALRAWGAETAEERVRFSQELFGHVPPRTLTLRPRG
jgi:hypothetical protein